MRLCSGPSAPGCRPTGTALSVPRVHRGAMTQAPTSVDRCVITVTSRFAKGTALGCANQVGCRRAVRGRLPRSLGGVVSLDSCQDVLARRRVPVFLIHVGEHRIRELLGVVARESLLAARAPQGEIVHGHQSHRSTPAMPPRTYPYLSSRRSAGGGKAHLPQFSVRYPFATAASSVAASMSVKFADSILSINGPVTRPMGPPRGTYR